MSSMTFEVWRLGNDASWKIELNGQVCRRHPNIKTAIKNVRAAVKDARD